MKLPPHIKGLIFDCDGTLADTMPLHWHAWQIVTQRHNLHFPEDRFYSFGGVPSRDILKLLAQEQGRSLDHIAVAHEKEAAYMPLITQVGRFMPSWKLRRQITEKFRWPSRPAARSKSSCKCWSIENPASV
jgi:beta-phosphoglucomutase-like phosphatase (HAD superfamily)